MAQTVPKNNKEGKKIKDLFLIQVLITGYGWGNYSNRKYGTRSRAEQAILHFNSLPRSDEYNLRVVSC